MECWDGGMDLVFPVISFLTERIIQEIYNSNKLLVLTVGFIRVFIGEEAG
jgi:hypothetical protein